MDLTRLPARFSLLALLALTACGDRIVTPSAPADVTLSAGGTVTCRLRETGAAECWGTNWWGQLGKDTQERCDLNSPCKRRPVRVADGLSFRTIAASTASSVWSGHICGITTQQALFCWGVDKTQLGTERTDTEHCVSINGLVGQPCSREPVRVVADRMFLQVATGDFHTCALADDGTARCWGSDDNGQLGSRETEICGEFDLPCSFDPVTVSAEAEFVDLAAGALHTCALATDGLTHCWGNNDAGQLGHEAPFGTHVPAQTAGGRGFVAITAGRGHTCGLTPDGGAYCWGQNPSGQLGNGSAVETASQGRVLAARQFAAVSAGWEHTCGLTVDGDAYCWGSNVFGQVGADTRDIRDCPVRGGCTLRPLPVETDLRFMVIAAGGVHTCAVGTDGFTYCWGDNSLGQLGHTVVSRSQTPVRVGS